MAKLKFEHGDLVAVARKVGISRGFLNNILRGRRRAPPARIQALIEATASVGVTTTVWDWNFPLETQNPAFTSLGEIVNEA